MQGAAVLAVGMGVGRFVYTPILPLMEHQALRLITGIASALLFVIATSAMLARLHRGAQHLVGWGFGGVGLGIALSGGLVLVLQSMSTWRAAWWGAAVLAAILGAAAWTLRPESAGETTSPRRHGDLPRTHRWFAALLTSYTLEGIGYIIAGTFLVAAISQSSPGWLGSGAWVMVGIAAIPASAMWAYLAHRRPRSTLILVALIVQAVGIALPSLFGGIAPALISAVLFGNTFVAISSLTLAIGAHLQFPRSIAFLTAGYSVGQILGPLVVKPLLHDGYHDALLVGSAVVLAGAVAAIALRIGFPHRVGVMIEPSRTERGYSA